MKAYLRAKGELALTLELDSKDGRPVYDNTAQWTELERLLKGLGWKLVDARFTQE